MNPLASLEAAFAALVVLWLVAGLFANPLLLGAALALALVPLALVVLPALGVRALGDRSVSVRPRQSDRADVGSGPSARRGVFPSDD